MVADADGDGRRIRWEFDGTDADINQGCAGLLQHDMFAPGPDADWSAIAPELWPATTQPAIRRVADGTTSRVDLSRADRLRMLGNGVVPLQAAAALTYLIEGAFSD